jgi:uncharacterized protein (TIGR00369 family)
MIKKSQSSKLTCGKSIWGRSISMDGLISKKENLIKLPHIEGINCFGCGHSNPVGLKMDFFADETFVYSWLTLADHFCSYDKYVHGGIVATVLDEIMTWAALYFMKKFVLTKSININYLKTVYTDIEIRVEGKVCERLSEKKVIMEGFVYSNDELCAKSTGEYVLIDSFAKNTSPL